MKRNHIKTMARKTSKYQHFISEITFVQIKQIVLSPNSRKSQQKENPLNKKPECYQKNL